MEKEFICRRETRRHRLRRIVEGTGDGAGTGAGGGWFKGNIFVVVFLLPFCLFPILIFFILTSKFENFFRL